MPKEQALGTGSCWVVYTILKFVFNMHGVGPVQARLPRYTRGDQTLSLRCISEKAVKPVRIAYCKPQ